MFVDVSKKLTVFSNLSKTEVKVFSLDFTDFFFSKNLLKEDIRFCTSASSSDCTTMVRTATYVGGVESVTVTMAIGTLVVAASMLADTTSNFFSANISSFFCSCSSSSSVELLYLAILPTMPEPKYLNGSLVLSSVTLVYLLAWIHYPS